jgi:hypothetical protein
MKVTIKKAKTKEQPKYPALYRAKNGCSVPTFTVLATAPHTGLVIESENGAGLRVGHIDSTFIDFDDTEHWQFMGYIEALNITVKA